MGLGRQGYGNGCTLASLECALEFDAPSNRTPSVKLIERVRSNQGNTVLHCVSIRRSSSHVSPLPLPSFIWIEAEQSKYHLEKANQKSQTMFLKLNVPVLV